MVIFYCFVLLFIFIDLNYHRVPYFRSKKLANLVIAQRIILPIFPILPILPNLPILPILPVLLIPPCPPYPPSAAWGGGRRRAVRGKRRLRPQRAGCAGRAHLLPAQARHVSPPKSSCEIDQSAATITG